MKLDRYIVPGLQGIRSPPIAVKQADGQRLKAPYLAFALAVRDHHIEPDMGIGPSQLFDDALDRHVLGWVEHCKGMVRRCGGGGDQARETQDERFCYPSAVEHAH